MQLPNDVHYEGDAWPAGGMKIVNKRGKTTAGLLVLLVLILLSTSLLMLGLNYCCFPRTYHSAPADSSR